MAEASGLQHDFTQRFVNVQWGGLQFLYSGADGMFGSRNGTTWKELKEGAVPATGLAWVDGVWLATGNGGPWRSVDGGKTWDAAGGPEFKQIAACKPKADAIDKEGQPIKNGLFAGYKEDEEGDNGELYISMDLGETWTKELTIPTTVGADGFEYAQVLSGCGNGLFLSTVKGDERDAQGDGCVYVSMDGGGFGDRQKVWSGTNRHFDDPPALRALTKLYSAGAVGFDSKSEQFCLMCYKEEGFGPGGAEGSLIEYSIIYATAGSDGLFSGENEIIKRTQPPLATAYKQVNGGNFAAGGDGKFVGTYSDNTWVRVGPPLKGDLTVDFFGGDTASDVLITVPNLFYESAGAQIGPVCWKPGKTGGTFACVAFGADKEGGGVWTTAGPPPPPEGGAPPPEGANDKPSGGWDQTHSGKGLTGDPRGLRAGLAVGRLSWL